MAWIKTIAPEAAEGELKELYDVIADVRGGVADVHQSQTLSPDDATLLRWARRAALTPDQCGQTGIDELRAAGFDDRAILDATLTVGYFSFVNRLVLLLGVEVEADYEMTCKGTVRRIHKSERISTGFFTMSLQPSFTQRAL